MIPSEEFLRHAAECEHMAAFTRDPDSKTAWSRMAERWLRCAELALKYDSDTHKKTRQHRKPALRWSH